jgi:uncharacterized protein (UPF0248 family)
MQPLRQLLHRIKWDPGFGDGEFALGYYDRVLDREIVVPFASVTVDVPGQDAFTFMDERGVARHVPLHRVRSVYKNGAAIWRRPPRQTRNGR